MNKKIKENTSIVSFIVVIIVFTLFTKGQLLAKSNLQLIVEQSIVLMIMCAGVLFVISMGCLDFSQGSILALSCYIGAVFSQQGTFACVLGCLMTGATIGMINGVLHGVVKIPAFIATISTQFVFRGLVVYFTRNGAIQVPFQFFEFDALQYKIPILLAVLLLSLLLFRYTKLGRFVKAVGAGSVAAQYSGVNVTAIKVIAFSFAGLMAGVAAFINLTRAGTATPNTGNLMETNVMVALVLGGLPISGGTKAKFTSVLIGAVLLTVLTNGLVLLGVGIISQQLIKGLAFIIMIMLSIDRKDQAIVK